MNELRKEFHKNFRYTQYTDPDLGKVWEWIERKMLEQKASQMEKIAKEIVKREEICYDAMTDANAVENGAIEKNLDVFYAGKHRAYEEMSNYISNFSA